MITTLFLDIGGILLSNGWGRDARDKAVAHFGLDREELNERHHLTFSIYEEGKLSLHDYLQRIVFYEPRPFSEADFIAFMYAQSQPFPDAIAFFKTIRERFRLNVVAVSNEGKELNTYRIRQFGLDEIFDAYISSSFVHLRKPDVDIFRMAVDIAQATPENSIYIDDRLLFVQVARSLGMNGMHYRGLEEAKQQLRQFGLTE